MSSTEWYEYGAPNIDAHVIGAIHRYVKWTPQVKAALHDYAQAHRGEGIDWSDHVVALTGQTAISGQIQNYLHRHPDDAVDYVHQKMQQIKHQLGVEFAKTIADPQSESEIITGLEWPR